MDKSLLWIYYPERRLDVDDLFEDDTFEMTPRELFGLPNSLVAVAAKEIFFSGVYSTLD